MNPIDNMQWLDRKLLKPNDYNPNNVAPQELELLKNSIKNCGWTQPIVIRQSFEIVDGFHRWTVSGIPEIGEITNYQVPCVILSEQASLQDQMAATITHNRARGSHHVLKMADIVTTLKHQLGVSDEWIMERLGMEQEEVSRLSDASGSPVIMGDDEFSNGWVLDEGRFET